MALLEAATGIVLAGQWIYHRWKDAHTPIPAPGEVLRIPKVEEGTTIPIVMGRARIDRPVIAWSGNLDADTNPYDSNLVYYEGDVLFVLGIPFYDGTTRLQGIYVSGQRRTNGGQPSDFAPNLAAPPIVASVAGPTPTSRPDYVQIFYEFGAGLSSQDLGTGTNTSSRMVTSGVSADDIPGFRGYATFLARFSINTVEIPAIAFELSTYPTSDYFNGFFGSYQVGDDLNPAIAIAAILCDPFGKLGLGLGTDILDQPSFAKAAATLNSEGHGYSRCWDTATNAREMIAEILEQIDGVLYEDPATGLLTLKLVRPDYDPNSLLHIGPANCEDLEGLTLTTGVGQPNKIVVKYPDRGKEYQPGSAEALDQASAFAGEEREQSLSFPGCCTFALANQIAARELAARSRPLLTCTAIVDRSFWDVRPGDVVRLSWPASYVSNRVMRVANVHRGGPSSNTIRLDLIQDVFYVYRSQVLPGTVAPFPDAATVE